MPLQSLAVFRRLSTTERVLPSAPEFCSERHKGTGQLARPNIDSNICPRPSTQPISTGSSSIFCMGTVRHRAMEKIQAHSRACAWAEDAQTPPLPNICFQLKCLSCPVTRSLPQPRQKKQELLFFLCSLPDCKVSVLLRACGSGIVQETLAGRSGSVSVKCFTNNDKKLQKFTSALNE